MTHNDTLRRVRYALNINDAKIAETVTRTGRNTTADEVVNWLKREDEPGYAELSPALLCRFFDGLIIDLAVTDEPCPQGRVDPITLGLGQIGIDLNQAVRRSPHKPAVIEV